MDDEYDIDARMQLRRTVDLLPDVEHARVDMASAFEWLLVLGILCHLDVLVQAATRPPSNPTRLMKPPNLQTSRLILRPLKLDDACIATSLCSLEIIQNLSLAVPWPYPDNGAHQFIQQRLQPDSDDLVWAITERKRSKS